MNAILLCLVLVATEPFTLTVRSTDIDQNGHVGNATYVEYMQCARWDWIKKETGLTHADFVKKNEIPIVMEVTKVKYLQACHEGDYLTIRTIPLGISGKDFTFRTVMRRDGEIVTIGEVTMRTYAPEVGHTVRVTPEIREAFERNIEE